MRYLSVTSIIFLFFLLVLPNAQERDKTESHNAYYWEKMTESFKLGYLIGFADAAYNITYDTEIHRNRLLNGKKDVFTKDDLSEQFDFMLFYFRWDYSLASGTYGQYMDGINEIYNDYRNKLIPINELIAIVNLSLTGATKERIEEELRSLREIY